MGMHPNVGPDKMPKQGDALGAVCVVVFHIDISRRFPATCLRDDMEAPFLTVLALEDGRVVLGTECTYSFGQPVAEVA